MSFFTEGIKLNIYLTLEIGHIIKNHLNFVLINFKMFTAKFYQF